MKKYFISVLILIFCLFLSCHNESSEFKGQFTVGISIENLQTNDIYSKTTLDLKVYKPNKNEILSQYTGSFNENRQSLITYKVNNKGQYKFVFEFIYGTDKILIARAIKTIHVSSLNNNETITQNDFEPFPDNDEDGFSNLFEIVNGTNPLKKAVFKIPPDTGQQKCYSNVEEIPCPDQNESFYGQDAQFNRNTMSFTDNGDFTITDNNTGLTWAKCSYGQSNNDCTGSIESIAWTTAINYCKNLLLSEYDWRLPNRKELHSIIDYSKKYPGPTIQTIYFPNTKINYWTSSIKADQTIDAWYTEFEHGEQFAIVKTAKHHVRCIAD